MAKGRIAELAAPVELTREEACNVVTGRELDRAGVRLERLHEDAPRRIAAAASGELREQLESALLCAEVRQAEPRVRVDDRRERNAGEVMTFRHHLRSDQHDAVGCGEARERRGKRTGPFHRIRVEPDAFELRQLRLQLALEALSPRP